jgi:hypothetical protein
VSAGRPPSADLTAETFACALEGIERFDPERGSAVNRLFRRPCHPMNPLVGAHRLRLVSNVS